MELPKDWKEFIELLNENEVEYLIVGALALAYYGIPRLTDDIDFWINPTPQNVEKLMKVFEKFGFGFVREKEKDFCLPNKILQLGNPPLRIDVMTSIDAVNFKNAWGQKQKCDFGNVWAWMISKEDYIRNKKSLSRPKDIADLYALEEE